MIGHLGLHVTDLGASKAYYDELMALLDFSIFISDDTQTAYMPHKPGTMLFLYATHNPRPYVQDETGLQHIAFMAPTRSRVDEVRDLVARLGSPIVHEPREWPEYPPPYYATFWRDPNGFLLEAVCHYDRD